jgi:hypothetical protein
MPWVQTVATQQLTVLQQLVVVEEAQQMAAQEVTVVQAVAVEARAVLAELVTHLQLLHHKVTMVV